MAVDSRLQERICAQLRLAQLARSLSPNAAVPYFAHMRLRTDERVRDVLLGPETRTGGGVAIIDWRSAPLAEVFFFPAPRATTMRSTLTSAP